MAVPFQAQAYNSFLSVLGKDSSHNKSITRDQLLGGIAYYLTALPHPYVRSFATLTISSPALWGSIPRLSSFDKVHPSAWGVRQAIQQAVVAKHTALQDDPNMSSILPPLGHQRVQLAFTEWLDLLVSGSQPRTGSRDFALPRLAFLSGLLLGLKDLEKQDIRVSRRSFERCCAEMVVSVAECLDQYVASATKEDPMPAWDSRLALQFRGAEPHLDAVVELCAAVLPLAPSEQLVALDLSKLTCVCFGSVLYIFQDGHCFESLQSELVKLDSGLLGFKAESRLSSEIQSTHSSSVYIHLGSIAKMIGHLLICMAQSKFWQPRLYPILVSYVDGFGGMSLTLERSWSCGLLSRVKKDEEVDAEARSTTTHIWHMLKSLLFTSVLVSQSVLDVAIHYSAITPREGKVLARSILMVFCRLSFISTKFGALTAEGGGFSEMKRAFFGALDVLAFNYDDRDTTGDQSCVKLIVDLAGELADIERSLGANTIWHGRVTYFLVCAEHVMNQLPEEVIIQTVLPVVQRQLSDAENREIYEAAHSVMLAIFAAYEAQAPPTVENPKLHRVHLLVPAYINILLRNSDEDRLSTDQLCLAFQALVRSASTRDEELGWFCVEQFVVSVKQLAISKPGANEQVLRLQLALISSMSAVPTSKLPLLLGTIYDQILSNQASQGALADAAYREIAERLGDREKDIALDWWTKVRSDLNVAR